MNILIAYRMNQHSKNTAGIFSKMLGQGAAFAELGHEVRAIYMSLNQMTLARIDQQATLHVIEQIGPVAKQGERDRFWQLATQLQDCQSWRADMLYARYDMMFTSRAFLDFLARCKEVGSKVIVEFPTYPYALEIEDVCDREADQQYVQGISEYADLICSTCPDPKVLGVNNLFFNNKVFVNSQRLSQTSSPLISQDGHINLLMVANFKFWHACDRLLHGLRHYLDLPQAHKSIHLDLVGGGDELVRLKALCADLSLSEHVNFAGFVAESDLHAYFDKASIGIASLGLHRIGILQSSVLKVREYISQGLPIVMANEDSDLLDFPWCLQIPQDESAVDLEKVIEFAHHCDQQQGIRHNVREYARQHLSWKSFAVQLLDVISVDKFTL